MYFRRIQNGSRHFLSIKYIVTSNCIYLALTILIAMVSTAIPFGKLDLNKDSTSSLYMDYCYIYLVLDQLAFKSLPKVPDNPYCHYLRGNSKRRGEQGEGHEHPHGVRASILETA